MTTVGIAAPLAGNSASRRPAAERKFALIDRDNLDEVLARIAPELNLSIPNTVAGSGELAVLLRFASMDDFEPLAVARQIPSLARLLDGEPPQEAPPSPPAPNTAAPGNLLDDILGQAVGEPSRDSPFVQSLVKDAMKGTQTFRKENVEGRRAAMEALSKQLSVVLHHPDFQRLEAAWRGLQRLVLSADTGPDLKLRVIDATKDELPALSERAFAPPEPFTMLLADFGIGPEDAALLGELASGPVLAGASPTLVGHLSWPEWEDARNDPQEGGDWKEWREFRDTPAAASLTLIGPRVMARLPYGEGGRLAEGLEGFDECDRSPAGKAKALPHGEYLWMNAAWVLAESLLRGDDGVDRLPVHAYDDEGEMEMKCPTELRLTDRHAAMLHRLGLLGLAHIPRSDRAGFVGKRTLSTGG